MFSGPSATHLVYSQYLNPTEGMQVAWRFAARSAAHDMTIMGVVLANPECPKELIVEPHWVGSSGFVLDEGLQQVPEKLDGLSSSYAMDVTICLLADRTLRHNSFCSSPLLQLPLVYDALLILTCHMGQRKEAERYGSKASAAPKPVITSITWSR